MKNVNITLQPLSLLVGAAIVGLSLVTTGAFTPQGSSSARDVNTIAIDGQHKPKDVVFISDANAYTVPAGKSLTLLSLFGTGGGAITGYDVQLNVNGSPWLMLRMGSQWADGNGYTSLSNNLASGLSFQAGTTLELEDWTTQVSATVAAYLTDA